MTIDARILDEFLSGRDPQVLFSKGGLIDELRRMLSERADIEERA